MTDAVLSDRYVTWKVSAFRPTNEADTKQCRAPSIHLLSLGSTEASVQGAIVLILTAFPASAPREMNNAESIHFRKHWT